jgi:hypothetical protein
MEDVGIFMAILSILHPNGIPILRPFAVVASRSLSKKRQFFRQKNLAKKL